METDKIFEQASPVPVYRHQVLAKVSTEAVVCSIV